MSTFEPYTPAEMTDDVITWSAASDEQKAAAFFDLLAGATAVALHGQNKTMIETLREIRAERDGTQA